MINSQLSYCAPRFASEEIKNINMQKLQYSQTEYKSFKQNNLKTISSHPGSLSNSNSSPNVYVDMGKVLLEAAKVGDSNKVQECVTSGAPFITDWLGTSALHIAAKNNFYNTCAMLLRSGISKDAKTKVDRSPLHFAVFEGNYEICQLLIQYECSIDPQDMLKMTPLHWAIEKGFNNIAELLLENGANPHALSKFLKTPFSIAKEKNNETVTNMIKNIPSTGKKIKILNDCLENFTKTITRLEDTSESLTSKPIIQKRPKFQSYVAMDSKRSKTALNDVNSLTLHLLKEQMSMMSSAEDNLIQSAIKSGRKIILTEAGKRLLNDSNPNELLKKPLNTSISSPSTIGATASGKSLQPSSATVTSCRLDESLDVPGNLSDNEMTISKNMKTDVYNFVRSSSDLQEVTAIHRLKRSPVRSPIHSLSTIYVPKVNIHQGQQKPKIQLPLSSNMGLQRSGADISQLDMKSHQISELSNSYNQLKRSFEREQQKNSCLQRQLKQLEMNFELFKKQQNDKFDSILKLLIGNQQQINEVNGGDVEEIL